MEGRTTFRPAAKADASALAVLVDIAGEGLPAHLWSTLKAPGQSILEVGRERAAREKGGFSYRNAIVAEVDGEIAACLVGYRLDDPYDLGDLEQVPPLVRPLVLLEAKAPGSWYVNVLATFPEFRAARDRHGVAWHRRGESACEEAAHGAKRHRRGRERACGAALRRRRLRGSATEPIFAFPGCPHGGDWLLMVKPLPADG